MRETLAGSGMVGQDLLAVNWDATPLGDPDTWPLSLSNAVRIILSSKFSMWMAWGDELTFFCNDAYRRNTLGAKYPWALGRSAREVWAEIWPEIGPRIERVIATGEATWDEALQLFLERSGYREETYHTFSYSPLTDDDGTINGMLCVVAEVTDEIVNQRRMSTLRDLGIRVSTAESVADAVVAGCDHLALNDESLPWVAVYLFDDDGVAELAGTAGIVPGHAAAPRRIAADDHGAIWPAHRLLSGEEVVVDDIDRRITDLPTGAWESPPEKAVLVPIPRPLSPSPYGFLVFGANRHRPVDRSFFEFVELIAAHFSAAITDARAMQQEKERSEALARLDQARSDFLANVSHELRTPLTLVLGPAEDALADTEDPLPDPQRRRLDMIVRSGSRMLRLVNTLLDFSRLDAQHEDSSYFELTDLAEYTAALVGLFESPMQRAGLSLAFEGDPSVAAYVDRNHWARIVLNLLSNALKFTFEGGVTVRVQQQGSQAVLTVADTGTGIPEEEMSRLFERFHRVRGAESRSIEGTGIGLALVAQLVDVHGGEADVTSTLGEGSTFTVRIPQGAEHLPAEQVAPADGGQGSRAVVGQAVGDRAAALITETMGWLEGAHDRTRPGGDVGILGAGRAPVATVLVVDDNADMRRYLASTLAGSYRVIVAVDGIEALERLAAERVDLVITDVMMPRLDGFGLLARMKEDVELTAIPVIMVSARAGEEGTIEGLEAGADDYLVKPFSARELLARVRVNLEVERLEAVRDGLQRAQDLVDQAERIARFGSWEFDLDKGVLTGSTTFVSLLGLDHHEMEGLDLRSLIAMFVDADRVEEALATLATARVGDELVYDATVTDAAGERILLTVHAEVAEPSPSRRVLRGSVQDVTEQRRIQQQRISAEAARREAIREHAIAEELQHSLLPVVAGRLDFLEVASYYRPGVAGTQVGGDWYDVIDLGQGRTALVVGDVMGRGVRAAAVMGQVKSAARALARLDLPPGKVLENLDGIMRDVAPYGIVTCVYAVHDPGARTLTYANAGHVPPLLVDAEQRTTRLSVTGPPLGAGFYATTDQAVTADPGSILALYTDGLVERRGDDLDGRLDQLETALLQRREKPLQDLPTDLVDLLASDSSDDVAVVVAAVQEPGPEVMRVAIGLELSQIAMARDAVEARLVSWGIPEAVRRDVVLMTSELVTNAITHGQAPIELCLRRTDEEVLLEVCDGSPVSPRQRCPAIDEEHGRGLGIVERLSDRWGSRVVSRGKLVWAARRISG